MNKNSTRVTAIVGTTMALVIAGTAAVAAAGPRGRDDDRGFSGQPTAGKAGPVMGGVRGGPGGGIRGLDPDIERIERIVQTAGGTTTVRTEQGVVDGAAADSLSFSLANGEAVSVIIDDDTALVGYEEQEVTNRRGVSRTRIVPTEVEATAIEPGADVIVTSDAEDDADFVATRIVIKPAEPQEATDEAEADAEASVEETEGVEETTEGATATDA